MCCASGTVARKRIQRNTRFTGGYAAAVDVMSAILKVWRHIRNPTSSIDAYLKNNPAKFRPDLIWNNGALGFFERDRPNKNKNKMNNKMSSDMRSVPDPKIC